MEAKISLKQLQKRVDAEQQCFIEFLYNSTSKNLVTIQEITGFELVLIQKTIQELEAQKHR